MHIILLCAYIPGVLVVVMMTCDGTDRGLQTILTSLKLTPADDHAVCICSSGVVCYIRISSSCSSSNYNTIVFELK